MTTECFNLVEEPWIPVVLADGFPDRALRGPAPRVSLREAFEFGDRILDLRCYPHERIALMRLLICIAQRALDGPANEEEWRSCRGDLAAKAVAYLSQHKECFNLLGNGPRFLQAKGLQLKQDSEPVSVDKLNLVSAAGSTPTWQDNAGGSQRVWSPPQLALMLLTYQTCSPGGLIGIASWNGTDTGENKGSQHALATRDSAVHAYLLGHFLLDHIHLNLVSKDMLKPSEPNSDAWGAPVWESPPLGPSKIPVRSYLGRLVPMSRAIWLGDDGRTAILANGLRYEFYPEGPRDPSLTIVLRDEQPTVLRGRADKALWRELHAIAANRRGTAVRGPLTLSHASLLTRNCRVWAGAVLTDDNSDARVRGTIESVFRLPVQFIDDEDSAEIEDARIKPSPNRLYQQGVALAESCCSRLQDAVKRYRSTLGDRDNIRGVQARAATRYWTALEQKAESVLLNEVAVGGVGFNRDDPHWMVKSPWGREVRRAALDAYEFACPHATPNQLRAYAEGLKKLFGTDKQRRRGSSSAEGAEIACASKEETT